MDSFSGITKILGEKKHQLLQESHVLIVGLGGVGSWVCEALARSHVGYLTLVDMDDICVSNINRQLCATESSVGKLKVDVLGARVRDINSQAIVNVVPDFFTSSTKDLIFSTKYDLIVDCIDGVSAKALLIHSALEKGIPIITSGGIAGKSDPGKIMVKDLNATYDDFLLAQVRKKLKREYSFERSKKRKWGVPCVFSPEAMIYASSEGEVCKTIDPNMGERLTCSTGLGTLTYMVGVVAFHMAHQAVEILTGRDA